MYLFLSTITDVCIDHVGFKVVLGENRKKVRSRSGGAIRVDLLDEGLHKA